MFSLRKTTMLNVTDNGSVGLGLIQKIAENFERKSRENFEKVQIGGKEMVCVWGLIVGYAGSRRAHLWSTVVTRDIWQNHLSHHLTTFCYRDVRQTQLSAAFSAAWMYSAVTQGWLLVENWDIHIVGMALLSRLIKGRQACKEVKKRLWARRQKLNRSEQVAEKIPLYVPGKKE